MKVCIDQNKDVNLITFIHYLTKQTNKQTKIIIIIKIIIMITMLKFAAALI